MIDVSDIGAFLGLDVGNGEHHATAVTPAGEKAQVTEPVADAVGFAALPSFARRRADVLFAMLRNGTLYDPPPAPLVT